MTTFNNLPIELQFLIKSYVPKPIHPLIKKMDFRHTMLQINKYGLQSFFSICKFTKINKHPELTEYDYLDNWTGKYFSLVPDEENSFGMMQISAPFNKFKYLKNKKNEYFSMYSHPYPDIEGVTY